MNKMIFRWIHKNVWEYDSKQPGYNRNINTYFCSTVQCTWLHMYCTVYIQFLIFSLNNMLIFIFIPYPFDIFHRNAIDSCFVGLIIKLKELETTPSGCATIFQGVGTSPEYSRGWMSPISPFSIIRHWTQMNKLKIQLMFTFFNLCLRFAVRVNVDYFDVKDFLPKHGLLG